jgi:DNA-binding transcriptional regulator YiaG
MHALYKPEHFKELRKRLGYSAGDVARRIQSPLEKVKDWEAGISQPNSEEIAKLEILFQQAQLSCHELQTSSVTEVEMQKNSVDQMQSI